MAVIESIRSRLPESKEQFEARTKVPKDVDDRVRRAIHLAIDRRQLGDLLYPAFRGEPSYTLTGPVPPAMDRWALPQEELTLLPAYRTQRAEDLAEARRLWEAALGSMTIDGMAVLFAGMPKALAQKAAPALQRMLRDALVRIAAQHMLQARRTDHNWLCKKPLFGASQTFQGIFQPFIGDASLFYGVNQRLQCGGLHVYVATADQQPVTPGGHRENGRFRHGMSNRFHLEVIAQDHTLVAHLLTQDGLNNPRRECRGVLLVQRRNKDVGGHDERHLL